ncbi:MAG: hypothetical protein PHH31_05145, partial [Acidaminococcaceae bacterium]|nr:hypothetical protein [Acidaminococcaceae bacterium]
HIEVDACSMLASVVSSNPVDIVACNAKRIEGNKVSFMQRCINDDRRVITGEEFLKTELKFGTMYMAAPLNLYNRKFLQNNMLEFKVGILHEDEQFTPRVLLKAKTVISTNIVFYNYVIRDGSITMRKDLSKNGVDIIKTCYELSEVYEKVADRELRKLLNNHLVETYLYGFYIGQLYTREYHNVIKKDFLFKRATTARNRCKVFLFSVSPRLYYWVNRFAKEGLPKRKTRC